MQLYVWVEPYHVSYGQSAVFAIARSLKEAKAEAAKGVEHTYFDGPGTPKDWSSIKLGEPTRIVDLPCAEWHYWQE